MLSQDKTGVAKTFVRLGMLLLATLFWVGVGSTSVSPASAQEVRVLFDSFVLETKDNGTYELFPDAEVDIEVSGDGVAAGETVSLPDASAPLVENEGVLKARLLLPKEPGDKPLQLGTPEDSQQIATINVRSLPQVIDPSGQPAYGSRVSLLKRDEEGLWQIWTSPTGIQRNPKQLGVEGRYAFYVNPGEYRITIESQGAAKFTSDPIVVTENRILSVAAELRFQEELLSDIELDTSVVALVSSLLDRMRELAENGQVVNVTKKAIQPFSFLLAFTTMFGFLFSLIVQFGLSFATMPMLPLHLFQMIMHTFTGKPKLMTWGKVYDFKNNNPLPMASVMLFHEHDHKMVGMALTEMDGSYTFPSKEGKFSVFVTKDGYRFPSEAKSFVYRGDTFTISEDEIPVVNLAMDRETGAGEQTKALQLGKAMMEGFKVLLLFGGFLMSIWLIIFDPNIIQFSMLVLYLWMMYYKVKKIRRDRKVRQIQGV